MFTRGVHQDNPFIAILFIICVEVLAQRLHHEAASLRQELVIKYPFKPKTTLVVIC